MKHPRNIYIKDYTYHLPVEKIALFPLAKRDSSKLLIYKDGNIREDVFHNLHNHLPPGSLLVFNDTRVINARLLFKKATGASIEIFCLEPSARIIDFNLVMSQTGNAKWKCLIGGAAKWENEVLVKKCFIGGVEVTLMATKEKIKDGFLVDFTWSPSYFSFASILESAGDVPLPPYIKRRPEENDGERYQTIYAEQEGSVAAPTAGLHFTNNILYKLKENKIESAFITLHVGAGTFKPVTSPTMQDHVMHSEYINIHIDTIKKILKKPIITAVGTTSLRTLETLYWMGVKTVLDPGIKNLSLSQWDVYETPLPDANIEPKDALSALAVWMKKNKLENLFSQTQLLIVPGYKFRIANILITNFHQPQSTLLLLVAAAIGSNWKKMYEYALENNFRFLSYGDVNLVFMDES